MTDSNLFKLLNFDPNDEEVRRNFSLNTDDIIKKARENPRDVDLMYIFTKGTAWHRRSYPLHRAIELMLGVEVINALSGSIAIRQNLHGSTALHFACKYGASLDVIHALVSRWPDAAKEKNSRGHTPLHTACRSGASFDVIHALLNNWTDAAKEKNIWGRRPLHVACRKGASLDVIHALLCSWPHAVKEKSNSGYTPLHDACYYGASFNVIHALMRRWPDAVKEKDNWGHTPLHHASHTGASVAVVQLLLDLWLEAVENRNIHSVESLIGENTTSDVKNLLFHISSLFNEDQSNPSPHEIMIFFISVNWWTGALFVVSMYPTVTKTLNLHTEVIADYLSVVGKCCSLTTMTMVIQNEHDLLEGV